MVVVDNDSDFKITSQENMKCISMKGRPTQGRRKSYTQSGRAGKDPEGERPGHVVSTSVLP